jgi:hypothetical protein
LPDLLTKEKAQVLEGHQKQAHGTLDALNALMTRGLTAGQQHEVSLGDLLSDIRRDQHERGHYDWAAASVAFILIILLVYLTSRYWRRSLLMIASRWAWRQTRTPTGVPPPKPRITCPTVFSMIDQQCAVGAKSPMGHDEGCKEKKEPEP